MKVIKVFGVVVSSGICINDIIFVLYFLLTVCFVLGICIVVVGIIVSVVCRFIGNCYVRKTEAHISGYTPFANNLRRCYSVFLFIETICSFRDLFGSNLDWLTPPRHKPDIGRMMSIKGSIV